MILPKEKHTPSGPDENESEFALNVFFDGEKVYPINVTQHMAGEMRIIAPAGEVPSHLLATTKTLENPGVYQVIWYEKTVQWRHTVDLAALDDGTWLRPMPFGQIAFLTKVTHIEWLRLTIRAALHELTAQDLLLLADIAHHAKVQQLALVAADVNYRLHLQPSEVIDGTRFEMGVGVSDYGRSEEV